MKIARLCIFVITMIVFAGGVSAHSGNHWGSSGGHSWKSGSGECWNASSGSSGTDCGDAVPEPMAKEITGFYWPDDQDYDGVIDADDVCPFTPEGIAVESNGCAIDNDGDGVPDYLDKCPETPLGTVVDTDGCGRALVTLRGVHFKFDSAALTSEAKSILDRATSAINSNASQNISIEGHTDSTGSDSYNLDLSQRRAQSVVDYLVSKGVSASRLNAKGYGESNPATSNDTSASRAQNRRVEILAR
ncbi:MAG: OmpA family protein [Proteobacteria bacterium]|nr:OmpA family protein [Pseudomonadota bacterium]